MHALVAVDLHVIWQQVFHPHHVFFRSEEQLPRLASGKVAKHKLQQEAKLELGC